MLKTPDSITISKSKGTKTISIGFNIEKEQTSKIPLVAELQITQPLKNLQGQVFTTDNIKLPQFIFTSHQTDSDKKQENSDKKKLIDEIKEDKKKKVEVKCLCVHGKCNEGEELCNRCDSGWKGKLCDIQLNPVNINNNGKRLVRDKTTKKSESDDDSHKSKVEDPADKD